MATIRRNAPRAASARLSSRVGDMLLRRRGERVEKAVESAEATRKPTPGAPVVVTIGAEETPVSDALSKARYEVRPPRPGQYVHVSDLLSRCIRKIALLEQYEMSSPVQNLSLTDSLTYAQGDAIHDVLKARTARGEPRSVWGVWKCRCGTTKTLKPSLLSEVDQDQLCNACKTPRSNYQEVPMRDAELMIVGTPDLIMYLHAHDAFYASELKSIAHDKWKELVRPEPDHVMQILFYWFLMHRKGYRLANRVSILYATKGWLFSKSPTKEFTLDAPSMVHRLEPYLEDARALKAARQGGDLPLRICASERAPVATKCEACRVCFKGTNERPTKINLKQALSAK